MSRSPSRLSVERHANQSKNVAKHVYCVFNYFSYKLHGTQTPCGAEYQNVERRNSRINLKDALDLLVRLSAINHLFNDNAER